METVAAEVNVGEEGQSREVETIKPAMDSGAWQGDVGHSPCQAATMAHAAAHDASPVIAWAGVVVPRAHRRRRRALELESRFPVKKSRPLIQQPGATGCVLLDEK